MKPLKAPPGKQAHIRRDADGNYCHAGGAIAYPQPGETVEWFDTRAEAEQAQDVQDAKNADVQNLLLLDVNEAKSGAAYADKEAEARSLLASGETAPDPLEYPYVTDEMELRGWTAQEAATLIVAAADAAREQRRLRERERVARRVALG